MPLYFFHEGAGLDQLEADTELLNDYELSDDDDDIIAPAAGGAAALGSGEEGDLSEDSGGGSMDLDGDESEEEDGFDGDSSEEEGAPPAWRPKAGGRPAPGSGGKQGGSGKQGGGSKQQQQRQRGGIGKKKAKGGKVRGRDGGKGNSATNPNKQKPRSVHRKG